MNTEKQNTQNEVAEEGEARTQDEENKWESGIIESFMWYSITWESY